MESGYNVDPGEAVTLSIMIDNATGLESVDDLTIRYNTNVLDLSDDDVTLGPLMTGGVLIPNVNDPQGTIRITAYTVVPLSGGAGDLLNITFHVRANAPEGMTDLDLTAGAINEVPVTLVDGQIRVGTVVYDLNADNKINFADFSFFSSEFLKLVGAGNATPLTDQADFDNSGRVDFADFSWFSANFLRDPSDVILPPGAGGQNLRVAAVAAPSGPVADLTAAELTSVLDAALDRSLPLTLSDAVDTGRELELPAAAPPGAGELEDVAFEIVDLPGDLLGRVVDGSLIQIDINAAGYGWFVDTTPWDDSEFVPSDSTNGLVAWSNSEAAHRADLLTVVLHELGHLLGYEHAHGGPMQESLPLSTRRLWNDFDATPAEAVDALFAGDEAVRDESGA